MTSPGRGSMTSRTGATAPAWEWCVGCLTPPACRRVPRPPPTALPFGAASWWYCRPGISPRRPSSGHRGRSRSTSSTTRCTPWRRASPTDYWATGMARTTAAVRVDRADAPILRRLRAIHGELAATQATGTGSRWLTGTRWVVAGIFLGFGVTKFANHAAELASFRHYPLPAPGLFVYLVGALEIGGGLLLAAGLLTRLAAVALAADMIGAVVVSGLARGEVISLTLAPLLLVAMIILIRFGAGAWSLDSWLAAQL